MLIIEITFFILALILGSSIYMLNLYALNYFYMYECSSNCQALTGSTEHILRTKLLEMKFVFWKNTLLEYSYHYIMQLEAIIAYTDTYTP